MKTPDEEIIEALERRLMSLDVDHARALTPKRRREVEAKMREVRTKIEKTKRLAKELDEAAAKWSAETERRLCETFGMTPEEAKKLWDDYTARMH